jgi:hypothetical protein
MKRSNTPIVPKDEASKPKLDADVDRRAHDVIHLNEMAPEYDTTAAPVPFGTGFGATSLATLPCASWTLNKN